MRCRPRPRTPTSPAVARAPPRRAPERGRVATSAPRQDGRHDPRPQARDLPPRRPRHPPPAVRGPHPHRRHVERRQGARRRGRVPGPRGLLRRLTPPLGNDTDTDTDRSQIMQYQGTPTTSHTCAVHELAPHASRCRGRTTTVRFFPPCAETATATESHRARARIPRVASFPREVPDDTLGVGTC